MLFTPSLLLSKSEFNYLRKSISLAMPFMKCFSEKNLEADCVDASTPNHLDSPVGVSQTSRLDASSLISGLAYRHNDVATPSHSMQQWLNQSPNDEPWYHGARLAGDTV